MIDWTYVIIVVVLFIFFLFILLAAWMGTKEDREQREYNLKMKERKTLHDYVKMGGDLPGMSRMSDPDTARRVFKLNNDYLKEYEEKDEEKNYLPKM